MVLFLSTNYVNGQEEQDGSLVTESVKEQVEQTATNAAQDTTLPVAGGTVLATAATAIGLYLNDRKDKKKLETKITNVEQEAGEKKKQLDKIVLDLEIICFKIFYAAYIYPEKSLKQILDLKATNNPLEKNTLGEEYGEKINELAKIIQVNYNIPMPNMSVASPQVVAASSVVAENRATTPPVQPPPMTQHKTTENIAEPEALSTETTS